MTMRPIGTALPLGYFAFALGMMMLAGDVIGWFDGEEKLVGIVIAAYVFPLQLVATVMAYLGRDTVSGTTLGLFSTSWLAFGLLDVFRSPGPEPTVLGVFSLAFGVVILGLAVVASRNKPLFAAVLILCTARAVLDAIYVFTDVSALAFATGCIALAASVAAGYLGLSLLFENAWPGAVLPVFRRGPAAAALEGEITTSRAGIRAEPGVRDQL
ncbi:GPR1/FUN34/YaaH family transporter [Streptomyces bauhiniae]|uniref:GPR1/FUN34/yaaH family protein n=1 Tax=Streptomyces bauhiniae TaxID=2340725 RepID=A0A7K3QUG5_9ACTN|nr:GPR1/FUN34/YaaH family transporter [Streptomyces bauhiniae]NEB93518.1 hypothetical protein [Streptomyces bauhiniae]